MANTFKNASIAVNTTPGTVLYTAPAGKVGVVHALIVSNISVSPQTVTIRVIDASASSTFSIVTDAPIPVGGSISIPKPINLESGDAVRIIASTGSAIQAFASVLEMNNT